MPAFAMLLHTRGGCLGFILVSPMSGLLVQAFVYEQFRKFPDVPKFPTEPNISEAQSSTSAYSHGQGVAFIWKDVARFSEGQSIVIPILICQC